MKNVRNIILFVLFAVVQVFAQGEDEDIAVSISAPDISASFSIGFNYDLLNPPTDVSFDYPKGYIGLNLPLGKNNIGSFISDGIFEDNDAITWKALDEFKPTAEAKQFPNTSIKVDVPMWGGVASFSNTQNFQINYTNVLDESDLSYVTNSDVISLFMRGKGSVPMDFSLGWQTMTFGYAYEVNDKLRFAVNLHRHLFKFNLDSKVDIDIKGYAKPNDIEGLPDGLSIPAINFDYSSNDLYGKADVDFDAATWTATFGAKFWRFGLTSRFGMDIEAEGDFYARYSLPFFLDVESFMLNDSLMGGGDEDAQMNYFVDHINDFDRNLTDSIVFSTDEKMGWKMPHGHTITFDIVPEKLYLSYTKIFGNIEMSLGNIQTVRFSPQNGDSTVEEIDFKAGVTVDHIILLHGNFRSAFINAGVFSMDLYFMDNKNILENIDMLPYGDGMLLPVLNFGTTMGSKMQLLLELDVLPLPAVKTGLIYYF